MHLIVLLLPILLIKVFKRKLNGRLILTLIILIVVLETGTFFPVSYTLALQYIFGVTFLFVLGICLYYVITSWKNLRGAQWAIVGGLIFTVSIYLTSFILYLIIPNVWRSQYFNLLYSSVVNLGFPFSLLIYVSMRFKEMIQEVQENAHKVVELSEEKKEQAITQQKILEEEVARQTGEIRQTLANLKSTQSQLIQSEKMASLGELTAGIAHEIQNPLNFVNNFSEVTNELIDEMNEELDKGDVEEAKAIAGDIKQNLQKITHHGKRADSIVKGMLQHSRASSNQKEFANVNKLADEYLRLAYHGLRAKDKSFNAELVTNFDEKLPLVEIVPQDIGRVLLNLFTNAFYAVQERNKEEKDKGTTFKPTVKLSTSADNKFIKIRVEDNGTGIPEHIKDKIMQPFFTTKPTGEGTGLGLSMSYDIVVKAHGGTIDINSKEGEFTEFAITIPIEPKTTNS
ncbi:MAG: ATP-binding protein [Daejeonella sp.]|nr:ATP-binding protein [Daejeonella sp.]